MPVWLAIVVLMAAAVMMVAAFPTVPGLKVTMQQALIDEFSAELTPIMEEVLTGSSLPNQSGVIHIFLVGDVQYTISNINLTAIQFNQNSLVTLPNQGFEFQVYATANERTRTHAHTHHRDTQTHCELQYWRLWFARLRLVLEADQSYHRSYARVMPESDDVTQPTNQPTNQPYRVAL